MQVKKIPKLFEAKFDPKMQPGYQTRNMSLQKFTGGAEIVSTPQDSSLRVKTVKENLRQKFGSGQASQLLPSSLIKGK